MPKIPLNVLIPLIVLKRLCLFSGTETDDPLTKMGDYTRFLAWGRKSLDVIWSNIYEDSLGLGLMATAAMPVYSADTVSFDGSPIPGVLVGVVGHDAVIQEFVDAGLDPGTVVARLNRRSEVCHNVELADCQFQVCSPQKLQRRG